MSAEWLCFVVRRNDEAVNWEVAEKKMKKAIHEFEGRFDDNERDDKNLRPALTREEESVEAWAD